MKRLSKFFLAVLLLTVTAVSWGACPEGQKQTYKGCEAISGWPPADEHRIFGQLPCLFNVVQVSTSLSTGFKGGGAREARRAERGRATCL